MSGVQDLMTQTMDAFEEYDKALQEQMSAGDRLRETEMDLQFAQDLQYLDDKLDGKNAEIRAAQLRALTEDQCVAHAQAEQAHQHARYRTTRQLELLKTLRSLNLLIAMGDNS